MDLYAYHNFLSFLITEVINLEVFFRLFNSHIYDLKIKMFKPWTKCSFHIEHLKPFSSVSPWEWEWLRHDLGASKSYGNNAILPCCTLNAYFRSKCMCWIVRLQCYSKKRNLWKVMKWLAQSLCEGYQRTYERWTEFMQPILHSKVRLSSWKLVPTRQWMLHYSDLGLLFFGLMRENSL